MILDSIVIDSNALQRMDTVKKSNDHHSINLLAEFSSCIEANEFLMNTDVDLIFLEIEITKINGFEFLDILDASNISVPEIIITSKNTSFAFKSYSYGVVDFLSKPIENILFNKSVDKVLTKLNLLNNTNKQVKENQHIFVKSNLKKRKVFIKDIKWIEALGDYVKLITSNGSYVILSTMKAFENDLPKGKFLRIHKSYIINLKKIERYNSRFVEIDNFKIPLSRNKKNHLTDALESQS
ncbi:MAG: DNA-binding response regulator [Formosa sp.]|nr:DNA-binding response regulator [Formosa sp.]